MRFWVAAALTAAGLAGAVFWLQNEDLPVGEAPRLQQAEQPPAHGPTSLRGTRTRGRLDVDGQGHFVAGASALDLFEYHLSAIHERTLAELRADMVDDLQAQLGEPAAAEAEAFLDRYLDYRAELGDDARHIPPGDLDARFESLRALRRAHFGSNLAEQLFGVEERAISLQLERRRVLADADLDEEERRARLEALEEQLPESVREARARARAPLEAWKAEQGLREAGASEPEIQALREARLGSEAAERLRAIDAEKAEWEARLDRYRRERDRLRAALADHPDELFPTRSLRGREFAPDERERVERLDAIERVGGDEAP